MLLFLAIAAGASIPAFASRGGGATGACAVAVTTGINGDLGDLLSRMEREQSIAFVNDWNNGYQENTNGVHGSS